MKKHGRYERYGELRKVIAEHKLANGWTVIDTQIVRTLQEMETAHNQKRVFRAVWVITTQEFWWVNDYEFRARLQNRTDDSFNHEEFKATQSEIFELTRGLDPEISTAIFSTL